METITKGQAKMTYPKVSIIILNWNGLEYTIECLESLQKIIYPNYKVIVVDNGSRGNDAEVLQERLGAYIHLIKNDKTMALPKGIILACATLWQTHSLAISYF